MKLVLDLTDREVELLRNSTSDLGTNDVNCTRLQLKIASAILDASPTKMPDEFVVGQCVMVRLNSGRTSVGKITAFRDNGVITVAISDFEYDVPAENVCPLWPWKA